MRRYLGLIIVFLVAVLLYSSSFSNYVRKLNDAKTQSVKTETAYSTVRSFINLANEKDRQTLEQKTINRGLDLGFDVLLDREIKLLEIVGVPFTTETEISALVMAFDEQKQEFIHYVLLFIQENDRWYLYGFFRQNRGE